VTGVPVVKSIAVLRVLALLGVALADVNEEGSLRREETVVAVIIDEGASGGLDVRVGLSLLPGVEGRRATTTHLGGSQDRASADLEGDTIVNEGVVGIPREAIRGSIRGVNDAVNALSRASRPLRPLGESAVLLDTDELVGALNARGDGVGADADLVERGLDEGHTKNLSEVGNLTKLDRDEGVAGERNVANPERGDVLVGEFGVETTVVGGGGGTAVTGLKGNVAENVATRGGHVPKITAVVGARADGPGRPGVHLSVEGGNVGIRPLLVDGSLTTVADVTVLVGATVVASARGLAGEVVTSSLARPAAGVAVLEEVQLSAVDAAGAAEARLRAGRDVNAAVTLAVGVTLVAGEVAETSLGDALADSVLELGVELIEVGAVAGDDASGIVLPGDGALAVRVLPRLDGVLELSGRAKLNVNRAEVAVGLAAVLGLVIAVEPAVLTLIDAVSGPAELVGEVVDGVPEREVAGNGVDTVAVTEDSVLGVVVETVTVVVGEEDAVDVLGPVATVALRLDSVGAEVDVVLSSEGGILEGVAVVRGARVIVALPVLLVEHTGAGTVEGERETSELIELSLEALTVLGSTLDDGTGTDTDTTSPVTVARSRASRPLRPSGDVARNLGETLVDIGAGVARSAGDSEAVGVNSSLAVSDVVDLVTSPAEDLRIVDGGSVRLNRVPEILEVPVLRAPVEGSETVGIENSVDEVAASVVDTVTETATVLVVSTKVGANSGKLLLANEGVPVPVRVAVRETVEVLDKGQVADTTTRSGGDDLTSADAGHEEVVTADAVISVSALTPLRPLREDAVNGILVDVAENGHRGSLRGLVDLSEHVRSVVEESDLATRKAGRGRDDGRDTSLRVDGDDRGNREAEVRLREGSGTRSRASDAAKIGDVPVEAGKREAADTSLTVLDQGEDLDVVSDGVEEDRGVGLREGGEGSLVLVEAVLIGVGDVRDEVSVGVGRVTVVVETTTTVLLGRLATVAPVAVEIAAELRLASTVVTIRGIETGVEVVDGSVAVPLSEAVLEGGVHGEASRGRGSSPTTVGVVRAEGTLEEGAVNAFVLAAGDVSIVVARRADSARTRDLSLATVDGISVAVTETRLAGEAAETSSGGGGITVAKDGTVGEDVGGVDVLRAVDGTAGKEMYAWALSQPLEARPSTSRQRV